MTCAFTGHRPERLPWGCCEEDPRCAALKEQLREAVRGAYLSGARVFSCGMARGCDFYFAECVLELRREFPDVTLEAWLPCGTQADRWPERDRERYTALLKACGRVFLTEREYTDGCMLRRNRAMLDKADMLVSVYAGCGGGTGQAVAYAKSLGLPIQALWL